MQAVLLFLKENIISLVSLFLASLATFYTFHSTRIAKRAYTLALQEFQNKKANFSIYLIDSYFYKVTAENQSKTYFIFNITLNNKSENKNTFNTTLHIEYIREDNSLGKIIIEHTPIINKDLSKIGLSSFPADIKLEGKDSDSKWLIFEKPSNILNSHRIRKYTIKINDIDKNEESVDIFLLKQMINEND